MILDQKSAVVIETHINEQTNPVNRKYIGHYQPRVDGGKIFKYSRDRRTIEIVELATVESDTDVSLLAFEKRGEHGSGSQRKIHVEPRTAYVEAINLKNAIKKFQKGHLIYAT